MNPIALSVVISIVTFLISVATSMFVAGTRWGRVESEMKAMSDRLAKIEGMFTLRIRDPEPESRRDHGDWLT